MKIKCIWVFRKDRTWKAKSKDVSHMEAQKVWDLTFELLAQPETIRVMFEKGEIENDNECL